MLLKLMSIVTKCYKCWLYNWSKS